MEQPTAILGLFFPRLADKRRYCAEKYESFFRPAAWAASTRTRFKLLLPCRTRLVRRLAPLWLLPGHIPAHDTKWAASPKRLISAPVSATITSAIRRFTPEISSNR